MLFLPSACALFLETSHTATGRQLRELVAKQDGVPTEDIVLLLHGLRLCDHEECGPSDSIHLRFVRKGVVGGKGGFGAQLRSLAKQKGKKETTNFGACRDLSGRRLRHVNDEILLQKWKEAKESGDRFRAEQKTASGIDLWFLATPSWSMAKEDSRKRFAQMKRKMDICLDWKRARERRSPPAGAPLHWGCPRGARCSFAHGVNELQHEARLQAMGDAKEQKNQQYQEKKEAYMKSITDATKDDDQVRDLVMAGMRAAKRAKIAPASSATAAAAPKSASKLPSTHPTESSPAEAPAPAAAAAESPFQSPSSAVQLVKGEVMVERVSNSIVITGAAPFSTVALPCHEVLEGQWYWEATLVTEGLMQIGWARGGFVCAEDGDGVGDDDHSWAFDGYRQQCWHAGNGQAYGPQTGEIWTAGDVISSCLSIESDAGEQRRVTVSFYKNGESLGTAFSFSCTAEESTSFFPAISLDRGESLALLVDSAQFQPVPGDFLPCYSSLQ